MKTKIIKVIIADDFDLIRQGLKRVLEFEEDINIIGEADDGDKVLSIMKTSKPDILILDMNMPKKTGLEVLKSLRSENNNVKIIVLTIEDDYKIIKEVINMGADGYLLKDSVSEEIVDAVYTVFKGDKYIDKSLVSALFKDIRKDNNEKNAFDMLSKRELDILFYISKGYTNKKIGDKLFISEKTVKNYASNIFRKINVRDRVHATIYAIENKIEEYYKKIKDDMI